MTPIWSYNAPGLISQVNPSNGRGGMRITITGSGLLGGGTSILQVTLAGVVAQVTGYSNTQVNVTAGNAPAAASPGDVVVQADNGVMVSLSGGWQYLPPGSIAGFSPINGTVNTIITVFGSNLFGYGTQIVSASISSTAVIQSQNNFIVQLVVQSGAAGSSGSLVFTTDSGVTLTGPYPFTYLNVNINSVYPSQGPAGINVTISGTNLLCGGSSITVTLKGITATVLTASNNAIVVEAGSGALGTGPVVITSNNGGVLSQGNFTYVLGGDIHSVSPSSGQFGTIVTISGVNLLAGEKRVLFK